MKKTLPILSQIQYFYKKLFKDILENTSNQSFGKTSQGKSMVESILVNYKLTNFYSFRYIYFEKNPRINTLLFIMSINSHENVYGNFHKLPVLQKTNYTLNYTVFF